MHWLKICDIMILLELIKQKGMYPCEHMDSFRKFFDEKLPDRCQVFCSLKDECISEKTIHMLLEYA